MTGAKCSDDDNTHAHTPTGAVNTVQAALHSGLCNMVIQRKKIKSCFKYNISL